MQTTPASTGPVAGGVPDRHRLAAGVAVTLLAGLLILPPAGQLPLTSSDEARFVLIARDMLERGVWFGAVVREKQYRNKPPLYPWSIAAVGQLTGGVTEFSAGLPVALAAVGSVLGTFLLGDRLFGWRTGAVAALILTTTYGFVQQTFELLPDMLVLAFVTLAGWAFWSAVVDPGRRRWMAAFWVAVGLASFSKGPVGLLPLFPIAVWLLDAEGLRGLRRLWSAWGLALFGALTLGWVAPFLMLGADTFGEDVVAGNWLNWYLRGSGGNRLTRFLDLIVGLLPWTLVVPLAFGRAWRQRATPAVRFALLWSIVPILVLVVAANWRRRYWLPIYPGVALVVAWWALVKLPLPQRLARATGWLALAAAAAGVTSLVWAGHQPDVFLPALSWQALPLYLAVAFLGVSMFVALHANRPRLLVGGAVVSMLFLLSYGVWPYIRWVNRTQDFKGLAARVEQHAGAAPIAVYGGRFFELDYYLGRYLLRLRDVPQVQAYLARPEAPIVVVDGRAWRQLQGQLPATVQVIDTMRVRSWDMRLLRGGPPAAPGESRAEAGPR